jgi:gluconate 2-dehydrogenase gamma chain
MANDGAARPVSRRTFLRLSAASGLSAGVAVSCGAPAAPSRGPLPQVRLGTPTPAAEEVLTFFTAAQAAIVRAASGRIIPTDENGPGAIEAGVVYFVDRQLSQGGLGGPEYRLGPYQPGAPTQGDQSMLTMRDRYRIGPAAMDAFAHQQFGRGFVELSEQQQDEALRAMDGGQADQVVSVVGIENVPVEFTGTGPESVQHASPAGKVFGLQAFFEILRAHTIAGFFCDPIHGGNRGMVGWKLIGFPGAQIGGYRDWILNYGVPSDGGFVGLAEYHVQSAARVPWYPAYGSTTPAWGISPLQDQQLAGMVMWAPAGLIYLAAMLALLLAWLQAAERRA